MFPLEKEGVGAWVPQWVKCLPSTGVMVPAFWNPVPCQVPFSVGSCLLPLLHTLLVLSLI